MTEKRNDPVYGLVGVVGKDPATRTFGREKQYTVVEFSLAVTTGYGDDAKPTWYDVTVWNEGLHQPVLDDVYKGAKVAVEGFYSEREYNEKVYPQLSATRVGLVDWLQKTGGGQVRRNASPSAAAPGPRPSPRPAPEPNDFDDLPF